MKLSELKRLDEAKEVEPAQVFDEKTDQLKTAKPREVFEVRPALPGEKVEQAWVGQPSKTVKAERNQLVMRSKADAEKIRIIDKDELDDGYELTKSGRNPDAEGYQLFREKGEFEYFKHAGPPIAFKDNFGEEHIAFNGDYVLRPTGFKDDAFVVKASEFSKKYE